PAGSRGSRGGAGGGGGPAGASRRVHAPGGAQRQARSAAGGGDRGPDRRRVAGAAPARAAAARPRSLRPARGAACGATRARGADRVRHRFPGGGRGARQPGARDGGGARGVGAAGAGSRAAGRAVGEAESERFVAACHAPVVEVVTKVDLAARSPDGLGVSVVTGAGLEALRARLAEAAFGRLLALGDIEPVVTRARHRAA